jgi:hypothetical protein
MSRCPVHSVEPDALYVGCVCTYGGVYEKTRTFPELPESMLEPVDFYEDDEDPEDVLAAFEEGEKGLTGPPEVVPINHKLRWTQDEIEFLREGMFTMSVEEVARFLGRTVNACREQFFYGDGDGKETREIARRANDKIEASFRGKWTGTSLADMGF